MMESDKEAKKKGNKKLIVITSAIAAAVCIVAVTIIFSAGGSTEKRLAEQLDLAERYLSELDYESAIAAYEAAIEIDPKCEEAYLGLADIYIEQGEYEKAAEILEEVLAQIDSEDISDKLGEVEELMAEREKQAEEMSVSIGDALEEGNMSTEEVAAEGEVSTEEETADEEEVSAEETAATGRVSYADEMAAIANASVGDIVYWGSYEQDNDLTNGTEPVEWYVLEKADGEATLLAVYLLDCQQYHEESKDITWENCTLRSWLNSEFYNTTFSEEEQAAIVNTNVVNEDYPYYGGIEGGNDTVDKVWLLSFGEIERYFHIDMDDSDAYFELNMNDREYAIYCYGQDNRVCAKPTAYADARGVWTYSEEDAQYEMEDGYDMNYAIGNGWWWLRSPGCYGDYAAHVGGDGYVSRNGDFYKLSLVEVLSDGVIDSNGVRPALKVAY